MVVLHFGHNVNGLLLRPSFARLLPDRELECFLFGTAIFLPELLYWSCRTFHDKIGFDLDHGF